MKFEKKISLKWFAIALSLMAIISLGTIGYVISTSYVGTVSEVWVQPPFSEANYVIGHYNSTYYYAKNCTTGKYDVLSTNASYTIQWVINHGFDGMSIYFTQGVYYIDSTIQITKGLQMFGDALGYYWGPPTFPYASPYYIKGTTLALTKNCSLLHWNNSEVNHVYSCDFRFLEFNGGNMTKTKSFSWAPNPIGIANVILMEGGVSDVGFYRCFFDECGAEAVAIRALYANIWNIWFTECYIEANYGGNGINLVAVSPYRLQRIFITNCHFYDNNWDIFIFNNRVNDVSILGCTSEQTKYGFLFTFSSGRDITMSDNKIYDAGMATTGFYSNAIILNNTSNSVFSSNIINNLHYSTAIETAFDLINCSYVSLVANQIYNVTKNGIYLAQDDLNCIVSSNEIHDCGEMGIREGSGCDYNSLIGCTCTENTQKNITLTGVHTTVCACYNGTTWIKDSNENSGIATGTSPITVAHGLRGTPTIVTLGVNAAQPYSVSWTADATNIYIYHSAAGSLTVTWFAEYKP